MVRLRPIMNADNLDRRSEAEVSCVAHLEDGNLFAQVRTLASSVYFRPARYFPFLDICKKKKGLL